MFFTKLPKMNESNHFKSLLKEIYKLPMDGQKKILIQTFENWVKKPGAKDKTYDQIDDILVMGFRVSFPND